MNFGKLCLKITVFIWSVGIISLIIFGIYTSKGEIRVAFGDEKSHAVDGNNKITSESDVSDENYVYDITPYADNCQDLSNSGEENVEKCQESDENASEEVAKTVMYDPATDEKELEETKKAVEKYNKEHDLPEENDVPEVPEEHYKDNKCGYFVTISRPNLPEVSGIVTEYEPFYESNKVVLVVNNEKYYVSQDICKYEIP